MKEMYVSLSGAITREKQLAMVSNNLANINSVGFKREEAIFRVRPPETNWPRMERSHLDELSLPYPRQRMEGNRNYTAVAESYTDFSLGALRPTGNPYDMALEMRGTKRDDPVPFFVVETAQGKRLTRMGNFQVNSQDHLVTPDGYPLLGVNDQPLTVGGNPVEPIVVSKDGTINSNGQNIGQVQVQVVEQPQQLERVGEGLYSDRDGDVATRAPEAGDEIAVRHRYLEMANVNAVSELVKMIDLQRAYTTHERSIQTMDGASEEVVATAMGR